MLKFVTFAVKTQLNVHDLNNETVAGNVMDIRMMEFLDENGEKNEAPAVSGRMLKHWHYEGFRHLQMQEKFSICDGCKVGEPIRPGKFVEGKLKSSKITEEDAVKGCAICDIHGYLLAEKAQKESKQEGEKGISRRRSSRVMFSWLMPVLKSEIPQKQVVHTRVSQQETEEGASATQMIFNKSYASGIYAFVSALDVERIGLVDLNLGNEDKYAIDEEERKKRIRSAIEAYRYLISGQMGASLSHAIPHCDPKEILVAYSENGPLPFPVSPMYSGYLDKTIGLMPQGTQFLYWGESSPKNVVKKEDIEDIFEELKRKI